MPSNDVKVSICFKTFFLSFRNGLPFMSFTLVRSLGQLSALAPFFAPILFLSDLLEIEIALPEGETTLPEIMTALSEIHTTLRENCDNLFTR